MLRRFGSQIRDQWMGALALFLVLGGGTAYAVTEIDRDSVRSRHIADNQVKSIDVKNDDLNGVDIDESSLGSVPFAEEANAANTALSAGNADTLDSLDSTSFQARVSQSCAVGSAIRSIAADGSVTCQSASSPPAR